VSPAAGDMRRKKGEMLQRGLTRAEVVRWWDIGRLLKR
jgi:hypothetical protein